MNVRLIYSIKTKFVVTAAAIMALSSIIWGSWFMHREETQLKENLINKGRLLLTSLKVPIINTFIHQEMETAEIRGLLNDLIEEIVSSRDFNTVYLFIVDNDRKVLAHSRLSEYGKIDDDPLTRAAFAGTEYLHRIAGDTNSADAVLDIALPLKIHGKSWGVIRAGLSLNPLYMQLQSTRRVIWSFSLFFFLVGTALFYLVGVTMSRPLQNLSRIMTDVDPVTFEAVVPGERNDEIGHLQSSFSAMLARLKRSESQRQQAAASLIQHEKLAFFISSLVAGVAHEVNNPLAAISSCIYNLEQTVSGKSHDDLSVLKQGFAKIQNIVKQGVAHEVNNPLAAISSCIYNLEQTVPGKSHDDLSVLKQGFARIQNIVKQLSTFSQAANLTVQAVRSDTFFSEATSFARKSLKTGPVTFKATDRCEPPLTLVIDKGKLHQVVLNLLLNAAAASPTEGTIELRAYLSPGQYCLAVTDQGNGIPVERRERIFELFYTTKPSGDGTGIGLAICKSIVDMHHGTLQVESTPGETTFTVKIPVTTEANCVHLQNTHS